MALGIIFEGKDGELHALLFWVGGDSSSVSFFFSPSSFLNPSNQWPLLSLLNLLSDLLLASCYCYFNEEDISSTSAPSLYDSSKFMKIIMAYIYLPNICYTHTHTHLFIYLLNMLREFHGLYIYVGNRKCEFLWGFKHSLSKLRTSHLVEFTNTSKKSAPINLHALYLLFNMKKCSHNGEVQSIIGHFSLFCPLVLVSEDNKIGNAAMVHMEWINRS